MIPYIMNASILQMNLDNPLLSCVCCHGCIFPRLFVIVAIMMLVFAKAAPQFQTLHALCGLSLIITVRQL